MVDEIIKLKPTNWYILLVLKHLDTQRGEAVNIMSIISKSVKMFKEKFEGFCFTSIKDTLNNLKAVGFVVSSPIDKENYAPGPHVRWQITKAGKEHIRKTTDIFGRPKKKYLAQED
jgi:hypothetical protein